MTTTSASRAEAPRGPSTHAAPPVGSATATRGRRVVDLPTRLFHALLALAVAVAWLSGESERWRVVHVGAGLTVAALVTWRVVWGLIGPRGARLSAWARRAGGLRTAWREGGVRALAGAVPAAHAAAVLALLVVLVPLTASGWLRHEDLAGDVAEELHELLGNGVLLLIGGHLALVAWQVMRRGPDLLTRMVHGRTAGRGPDLVPARPAMAAVLLALVLGVWAWQWHDAATRRAQPARAGEVPVMAGGSRPSVEHPRDTRSTARQHDDDDHDD